MQNNYLHICEKKSKKKKQLALLIDPDKFHSLEIIDAANKAQVDVLLVGGSILTSGNIEETILKIKKQTTIPVIIFPGNTMQISNKADGILFLSLISGRNPELLIGNHVIAAPLLKSSQIEVIPTGYMLIENGKQTAAAYMSQSLPIPADKDEIAVCTALAGEMLGLKMIYMDAGSGAKNPISASMIKAVRKNISVPLIIGGGIKTAEQAVVACDAGADIVVIGNAFEKDFSLVETISKSIHSF
ncbi:MAG: geranylgeranylglyceryl/heptaprenylglyceryl phosphate synthase [Bacteroidia bacterium]